MQPQTPNAPHFHISACTPDPDVSCLAQTVDGYLPALAAARRLVQEAMPAGGSARWDPSGSTYPALLGTYAVLDAHGQIAAAVCLSGACRTDHTPVALAAQVGAEVPAPLAA